MVIAAHPLDGVSPRLCRVVRGRLVPCGQWVPLLSPEERDARERTLCAEISAKAAPPVAREIDGEDPRGAGGEGARAPLEDTQTEFPPSERPARRAAYSLRKRLRTFQRERQRRCGAVALGTEVAVVAGEDGAHLRGLEHCASVWSCPACSMKIRAGRAEEVTRAVEAHGAARVAMLTLTVRHGYGDALERTRRGVARAFQRVFRGRAGAALRGDLEGYVRALETTHGGNGWHPHLHVLLFLPHELDERGLEALRARFSERWCAAVARELGSAHVPSDAHGADLSPAHSAEYIAKLGLEITAPAGKEARAVGSRTPWQIAADLADHRHAGDVALWREWTQGMHGARMLTWSRGLRKRLALGPEKTDEELARESEERARNVVAVLDRETWALVRARTDGPALVLEAAERGGANEVSRVVRALAGRDPRPPGEHPPSVARPPGDVVPKRERLRRLHERLDAWLSGVGARGGDGERTPP